MTDPRTALSAVPTLPKSATEDKAEVALGLLLIASAVVAVAGAVAIVWAVTT